MQQIFSHGINDKTKRRNLTIETTVEYGYPYQVAS